MLYLIDIPTCIPIYHDFIIWHLKVADKAKTQTGLQAAYSLIAKGVFLGLLRFTSRLAFL